MKQDAHTYGPEDLENLLLEKDFEDLLPAEREFVLQHIDSHEEYQNLQFTLKQFIDVEEFPPPPQELKSQLVRLHKKTHGHNGFRIWLNTLFNSSSPSVSPWKRPILKLAGIAILVISSAYFLFFMEQSESKKELAVKPATEATSHESRDQLHTPPNPSTTEAETDKVSEEAQQEMEQVRTVAVESEANIEFNSNQMDLVEESDSYGAEHFELEDEIEPENQEFNSEITEASHEQKVFSDNVLKSEYQYREFNDETLIETIDKEADSLEEEIEAVVSSKSAPSQPAIQLAENQKTNPVSPGISNKIIDLLYTAW